MLQKVIAVLGLILVALVLWLEWTSPVLSRLMKGQPVEFLILGLDEAEGTHRADTIVLARLEPATPALKILQIPRDTLVSAATTSRPVRVNSLYERGGRAAIETEIQKLLSSNTTQMETPVTIQAWAVLNFTAFEEVFSADDLGQFRARDSMGDLGRLENQQGLYGDLLGGVLRSPKKIMTLSRFLKTNLSRYEMLALGWRLRSLYNPVNIYFCEMPGAGDEKGNFKVNKAALPALLAWWQKGISLAGPPSRPLRVEVLNASGQPGLAFRWTKMLRSLEGYDVLYFGNAANQETEKSFLISQRADLVLARQVLLDLNRKTGIHFTHRVAPKSLPGSAFTLLLGQDAITAPFLSRLTTLEEF